MEKIGEFELNKIYCMDCLEGLKKIPDNSVDLVLTDIPYGEVNKKGNGLRAMGHFDKGNANTINFDINKLTSEIIRVTRGSIYIFCGIEQVSDIKRLMIKDGLSTRLLIWEKTNPAPINGKFIWLSGIECCAYGKKSKAVFNSFCRNTILRYPCGNGNLHPTQKPIKMFRELVSISSNKNNIVLDPFMGSGTTAIACKQLGRKFLGFEIDQKYVDIANKRLSQDVLRFNEGLNIPSIQEIPQVSATNTDNTKVNP